MVETADVPNLFIVQPAQYAGAQPLRGGFGGEIRHRDADVDGAVVVALDLGAQGGGLVIGHLGQHHHHGCLSGKAVHPHAHTGLGHLLGLVAAADGQVIGLGVAGGGGQAHRLDDGRYLVRLYGTGVVFAAGLPCLRNFQKVHIRTSVLCYYSMVTSAGQGENILTFICGGCIMRHIQKMSFS